MIGLALSIGIIVGIAKIFIRLLADKRIILEKTGDEDLYTWYAASLWLLVLPPIAGLLFPSTYSTSGLVIFVMLHIPAIVAGKVLSGKMSTGFDYQRKAGKNIELGIWLALAGIGLAVFNYFVEIYAVASLE